jgi:hypothetical protein
MNLIEAKGVDRNPETPFVVNAQQNRAMFNSDYAGFF